jgi:hypothetical protein
MWVNKQEWQDLKWRVWTLEQQLPVKVAIPSEHPNGLWGFGGVECTGRKVPLQNFIMSLLRHLGIEAEYIKKEEDCVGFKPTRDKQE